MASHPCDPVSGSTESGGRLLSMSCATDAFRGAGGHDGRVPSISASAKCRYAWRTMAAPTLGDTPCSSNQSQISFEPFSASSLRFLSSASFSFSALRFLLASNRRTTSLVLTWPLCAMNRSNISACAALSRLRTWDSLQGSTFASSRKLTPAS